MKQKDIALIIVIAFISAVVSFIVSGQIFVSSDKREQQAEVVDVITADFKTPDKTYFNNDSINPTLTSNLGDGNNQNPFNGTTQ